MAVHHHFTSPKPSWLSVALQHPQRIPKALSMEAGCSAAPKPTALPAHLHELRAGAHMLAETQQEVLLRGQDLGQLQGQPVSMEHCTQPSSTIPHGPAAPSSSRLPHLCHLDFAICIFVILVHELLHLVAQAVPLGVLPAARGVGNIFPIPSHPSPHSHPCPHPIPPPPPSPSNPHTHVHPNSIPSPFLTPSHHHPWPRPCPYSHPRLHPHHHPTPISIPSPSHLRLHPISIPPHPIPVPIPSPIPIFILIPSPSYPIPIPVFQGRGHRTRSLVGVTPNGPSATATSIPASHQKLMDDLHLSSYPLPLFQKPHSSSIAFN